MKTSRSFFAFMLMVFHPASSHAFPALPAYLESYGRMPLRLAGLLAMLIVTAGVFWGFSKIFAITVARLSSWEEARYRTVSFHDHVILSAQQITSLFHILLRGIRLLVLLGAAFAFLKYAHILFPFHLYSGAYEVLRGIVFTLIATIVLGIFLRMLHTLFHHIVEHMTSWKGTLIRAIMVRDIQVVSEDHILSSVLFGLRLLRMGLYLAGIFLYIIFVFSFFAITATWASALFVLLVTPLRLMAVSFVRFLPDLFFILVFSGIAYFSIRIVRFVFGELERETISIPGFYPEWAMPTYKLVSIFIVFFTIIVVFPYLPGSDSPGFKGVSVFLGVLLSLGSTSAISNIVAGLVITYMRPFKVGDRVKIADTVGDVVEKSLLVSRFRTIKNEDITIPNAMILGSHIINYTSGSREQGLILHTAVTIGYDAPWRTVHELLISAACSTPGILASPEPFVFQKSLDDFSVSYELNAYTDQPGKMAAIYSSLHQNVQDAFAKADVEIMSPRYVAVRDGNHSTIPEKDSLASKGL